MLRDMRPVPQKPPCTVPPFCHVLPPGHSSPFFLSREHYPDFLKLIFEGERQTDIDLLFQVLHSLVDSCVCPDQGLNLRPWRIGTVLSQTELPSQGYPDFDSNNVLLFFNFLVLHYSVI